MSLVLYLAVAAIVGWILNLAGALMATGVSNLMRPEGAAPMWNATLFIFVFAIPYAMFFFGICYAIGWALSIIGELFDLKNYVDEDERGDIIKPTPTTP